MATIQNQLKNHSPVAVKAPVKVVVLVTANKQAPVFILAPIVATVAKARAPIIRLAAPRTKEAQMSRLAVRKRQTIPPTRRAKPLSRLVAPLALLYNLQFLLSAPASSTYEKE